MFLERAWPAPRSVTHGPRCGLLVHRGQELIITSFPGTNQASSVRRESRERRGGVHPIYLRTLLIHGARAAVAAAKCKQDARSRWITALAEWRGANIAAVALANKNMRILWALMVRGDEYRRAA